MKKIYILFTIISISLGTLSLTFQPSSGNAIIQLRIMQITVDQKVNKILLAEEGIYKLPYTREEIRFQIIPEIKTERLILAPNYPQTENIFGEDKKNLIRDWITNFPLEYDSYIMYVEQYIRSHK